MNILQAIFLGIIQGLTEFLPVSSSGHLVLAQEVMGIQGEHVFFFLMLHLGTLAAVIGVWFKDLFALFRQPKQLGLLALASVPAVAAALLLDSKIKPLFEDGTYLCFFFLVTAVLLLVTEIIVRKRGQKQKEVGLGGALIMGGMQAIAIVPGISRSGATITGGLLYGVEKDRATKFSFFMSIVVIVGGAAKELIDLIQSGSLAGIDVGATICGMLAAALTGFLAIKLMIKAISKINFKWFSLYLVVLSAVSFFNYFVSPIW